MPERSDLEAAGGREPGSSDSPAAGGSEPGSSDPVAAGAPEPGSSGPALDAWDVVAVAPHWRPAPGGHAVEPVAGRLVLFADRLVFEGGAEPEVIPATDVLEAGPLSPGSKLTPDEVAGRWMPKPLRRVRCPGFALRTSDGSWAFDCPHGQKRAREIGGRYA